MRKDDLKRMADERYGKGQGRFVYFPVKYYDLISKIYWAAQLGSVNVNEGLQCRGNLQL